MKVSYVKTHLQNIVNISKIVTVHYYEFDKNFVFDGEKHDFWEMVYIDKGRVLIQRDEDTIELSQGEIVLHKPNEFHAIRALDSAPNFFVISFVCLSSVMQYLEKYHTVLNRTLQPFISSILTETEKTYIIPKNDPYLKKLYKRKNTAIGGEQLIKTYLEQLLIFLIRDVLNTKETNLFPTKESMENHLILAVKEEIANNIESPFRLNELCFRLGYSKSYLSKLFKEQTGDTIASYAVKRKIKEAKRLIRESDLNFAQISDKLGFDNPQYFCRVFKRITNSTPTEFKHSLRFDE